MVQLQILSGRRAGERLQIAGFPCLFGRSVSADVQLEESGVWEKHAELNLDSSRTFVFSTHANALASINGQTVQSAPLRNGDVIELGAVRLQFWLAEARQGRLAVWEWSTWFLIGAVVLAEGALIYWLLQ